MKPFLVLIIGNIATRYINGKRDQSVRINFEASIQQIKSDIEYFRVNGVGD